jgi:hypothetical protein
LKIAQLMPVLPALILAACHGRPIPPPTIGPAAAIGPIPTIEQARGVGPAQGVDLPTDASDVLNEIEDNHIDFVARYYRDPSSRWPALSASEARRLSSLGVKIVAVYEPHSPNPGYFSYYSGYYDAIAAYGQAQAVGQPAGSAIYFAVDYNAQDFAPIEQYFNGIAAGLAAASGGRAPYEIGVYGSGAVCDAMKRAGLARYTWLSNAIAWTGSLGYDDWNIRQGDPAAGLSFNQDSDEARDDYGGFRLGNHAVAAPYIEAGAPAIMQAATP